MRSKRPILPPMHQKKLEQVGEQFKLARLRRRFSMELIAERANISRSTLANIEKGDPGVAIGNYYQVLVALGLSDDMLHLAADDVLGRKLQDIGLLTPKRAPKD